MMLFGAIDGLLTATQYLVWGIGLVGVPASAALAVVNFPLGISSSLTFAATLFIAVGTVFLLAPKRFSRGLFSSPLRFIAGAAALLIAVLIMGIVYAALGGFPALDLVFA